jgi:hypothetical protein
MAVRVRLSLKGPGDKEVVSSAVLNGGFEVPKPHLLLPAACAERLLGDFRATARDQAMEAAGGEVTLLLAEETVVGRIQTEDHTGREVKFRVLVSEHDPEVLVSDGGIDALGVRIESFAPGRWRFAEQTLVRETEAPQYW